MSMKDDEPETAVRNAVTVERDRWLAAIECEEQEYQNNRTVLAALDFVRRRGLGLRLYQRGDGPE